MNQRILTQLSSMAALAALCLVLISCGKAKDAKAEESQEKKATAEAKATPGSRRELNPPEVVSRQTTQTQSNSSVVTPPGVKTDGKGERAEVKKLEESLKGVVENAMAKEQERAALRSAKGKKDQAREKKLDEEIEELRQQRRALQEQMRVVIMKQLEAR